MSISVAKRIAALRRQIERHNRLYYEEASPEIRDADYDALLQELVALETQHPELRTADSPTQRIGERASPAFPAVAHQVPMLSLDNTYDEAELRAFHVRVVELLGGSTPEYVVEPKLDGVAVSLHFETGRFVRAVTRGDGRQGDDVTRNVGTLRDVPQRVAAPWPEFEVRGEIFMGQSVEARLWRGHPPPLKCLILRLRVPWRRSPETLRPCQPHAQPPTTFHAFSPGGRRRTRAECFRIASESPELQR